MISQATQVNFLQSNHKPFKAFQNKIAQCSFSTAENIVFNSGTQDIALSNGEKPLVVISVYPRHDSEDNNISPVKIIQHPTLSQKKVNNIDFNTFKRKEKQQNKDSFISVNKTRQRSPRSKSPSPGSTHIQNKTIADKTVGRVLGNKNNNMHNISPPQRNVNKSGHKLIKPKKDTSCYCTYSMGLENKDLVELKRTPKAYDIKETDTTKVKRALVNHFLKSVDRIDPSDTKMKLVTPQNDTSRVTINIDGEKEHYDLFFEQNDFDTGLSVRKSKKKPPINGTSGNDVYKNSKENLLMLSDEKKNGTYMYSHEKNVKPKIEPMLTRLKVRDSLEICHSRDGRTGSRLNTNENRGQNDLTDSFFNVALIAPVKHYRGDGCLIPDPNERDKEIRVLLGIVRNTRSIEKEESVANKHNYKTKRRDAHDTSSKVKISGQRIIDKIIFPADTKNNKNIKRDMNEYVNLNKVTPRQADSMEICYAHAYVKHVPISATHFGDGYHNKITRDIPKPSTSLHTIFKGHRKTATPNLGTSAYSLCSDANHSTKSITAPPYAGDCKPKKLFLQRLLSCLVMQSTETTILKEVPTRKLSSVNSSVDSYHISSSLGALEMTSSLYDTSASFYSNHVIKPTNKLKRSFLSSVREFLSNRRS
ncbi:jg10908 [Pararge aegeria aegeria]|uniref:Jg10908 protein n=1 Tax=Pararge aegeria aegeria TaxID=348720 RepID=A0A8S4SG61_9NEOP|nr:jg10908 [Pararge aegeria aegeria]